jgi:hypothetical protein
MRWLPGRAIRQSPCRGPVSTSSMPSTPGSGVRPPAVSSWSLKTESSPSWPLALHGDAKSPRRYSKRPLLILDVRWRRMGRRTAARSKNIEVASQGRSERCHIRIGEGHARTILLPTIGVVRAHDDTRRLRRLLRPVEYRRPLTGSPALAPRARVLFATVARHGNRWLISLNVEAPDSHAERRHPPPSVGCGKGLSGSIAALPPSPWPPPPMASRLPDSTPLGRSLADSAGYNAVRKPSRAASAVPAIALKPLAGLYGNTHALPISAKISYIGFRASWPRPTAS